MTDTRAARGYLTRCHRCGKLANTLRPCAVCGGTAHIEPDLELLPRIPLEDRKAYAATAPWVRRLKRPVACEGWMEGRKRCKKKAEWSYRTRSSRRWWGPSELRHLCWVHLGVGGFHRDPGEEERWDKFQEINPPPWWTEERQRKLDELNARASQGQ